MAHVLKTLISFMINAGDDDQYAVEGADPLAFTGIPNRQRQWISRNNRVIELLVCTVEAPFKVLLCLVHHVMEPR